MENNHTFTAQSDTLDAVGGSMLTQGKLIVDIKYSKPKY